MADKYSVMNEASAFAFLASALGGSRNGDGDTGAMMPRSDAEDMSKGARFIPGAVTEARREGEKVEFITECGPNCWYWKMPDGSRIYHYDPMTYAAIARANGKTAVPDGHGGTKFPSGVGPCPDCKNKHTHGGTVKGPRKKLGPKKKTEKRYLMRDDWHCSFERE